MPTQTELFLEKAMLYISKYCPELNFPRSLSNKINQYKKSFKKVFKTKLNILNICWFFPAFLAFTAFIGPLFIAFFPFALQASPIGRTDFNCHFNATRISKKNFHLGGDGNKQFFYFGLTHEKMIKVKNKQNLLWQMRNYL